MKKEKENLLLQHSGIQAGKSLVHENHEVNIQKNSPKNILKRKRTREKASKQGSMSKYCFFAWLNQISCRPKIALRNLIIIII
jgi:hypothetical protein